MSAPEENPIVPVPAGGPSETPKSDMKKTLDELLEEAGFHKRNSPRGGGIVITGCRPPQSEARKPEVD